MKKIIPLILVSAFLSISYNAFNNAAGPPAGTTGAPGNGNCTTCHTGSVINSGTNWSGITLTSNIPSSGYCAGQSYSITLSYSQSGITKYGFQATVFDASNNMAGSFAAGTGSSVQLSVGKYYVNHNSVGNLFTSGTASWTFTWIAPTSGLGIVTFYACLNAANGNGNELGDQIYSKSWSFNQGALPTALISADKTTICLGDTIQFSGSGNSNPTGYSWNFGAVASPSSSTLQNPTVVYIAPGTFTASLVTSNGCGGSSSTTQSITINTKPSALVTPSGTVALCGANDSLSLSAPVQSGVTYLWSPTNATTNSITVKSPGTYKVKVTNSNNCSATSSNVLVVQRSTPTVTLTSNLDSICQGDTVTFSGSGTFLTYKFNRDTQTVQNSNSKNFKTNTLTSSNIFSLSVADSFGCKSPVSNVKSILVRQPISAPVVTCGVSSSSSVQFVWNNMSNATGYQVSADTGRSWLNPSSGISGLSHSVTGLTGGKLVNVQVRALSQGACSHGLVASQTCQTLGCPYVSFNFSGPKFSCLSSDTSSKPETVTISNVNAIKYSVKIGSNNYNSSLSAFVNIVKGLNNIHIRISDSNNITCQQIDSVFVINGLNTPSTKPILSFSPFTSDTISVFCSSPMQTLYSSQPTGSGRYTFLRNGADTFQNSTSGVFSSSNLKFLNNDLASVIVTDTQYGCYKISSPVRMKVNPSPKASFSYSANGIDLQFTDKSTGKISSWFWNFGDFTPKSDQKNPFHTFVSFGTFNVSLIVTDSNTCMDTVTTSLAVTHLGIASMNLFPHLRMFPNPANNTVNIEFELPELTDVIYTIIDASGKEVQRVKLPELGSGYHLIPISVENIPSGLFMIQLQGGEHEQLIRMMKY